MEYQNLNINNRFYQYSVVIYVLSVLSSFLCGYYFCENICHIHINNETNI